MALALALAGCMIPQSYGQWRGTNTQAFTVAEIRQNPSAFLAAHAGERVQVEGWFVVDRLAAGATHPASGTIFCEGPVGGEQRVMLPGLTYNSATYPQAVRHRAVVEGVASAPRDLNLGGGDLTLTIPAGDMVLVLDQARMVAVDWSGPACNAAPYPAP